MTLTAREHAIAQALTEGLTAAEIAERLNLSTATIRTNQAVLRAKLGVERNRLIAYAYQQATTTRPTCTCHAKTPQPEFHTLGCPVRDPYAYQQKEGNQK